MLVYSNTPIEQCMRSLLPIVGYVLINNVYIVVSHIGETYSEDERSQARLGGYDPSTYQ